MTAVHSPDTSLRGDPEPCARCGCGRRTHHTVKLIDGGKATPCRGHQLSGGRAGSLQQCGCHDFEPRVPHCEHGTTTPSGDGDVECCACSLNPCEAMLADRARLLMEHVMYAQEMAALHCERSIRYVLAHGAREPVPF